MADVMRKSTKRKVRPLKTFFKPDEHKRLVTQPHMAMQLLLTSGATRAQLAILLGFFNLGAALAHFAEDEAFKAHVRRAQDIIALLDAAPTGTYAIRPGPDTDHLSAVVHAIDAYLKQAHKHVVEEAMNYVEAAIATKSTASAEVTSISQMRNELSNPSIKPAKPNNPD